MSMYHYNVNIIPAKQDFSIWVGVTVANKYDGAEGEFVREGTELWDAAIARARELCPSLKDCFCENWNGGDAVAPVQSFKPFFPESYKADIRELANLFRPFANRMVDLGYRLALDVHGDCFPTILPGNAVCCDRDSYSYEHAVAISTPQEVLENSFELIARGDLFTLVGERPYMALVKEDKE